MSMRSTTIIHGGLFILLLIMLYTVTRYTLWTGLSGLDKYVYGTILLLGLIIGSITLRSLEKLELGQLSSINDDLAAISSRKNFSSRIAVTGNGALADLGREVNKMLASLEQANKELNEDKERYRSLIENSYDLISEIDSQGNVIYVSPNCSQLIKYRPEDIIGRVVADFIHIEDRQAMIVMLQKILDDEEGRDLVCRVVSKDGDTCWLESTGKVYRTATGESRVVLISRDISERKRFDERIRHQAFYDLLTGLPNRMLFNDRMTMAIAHAKRNQQNLAVFYLDLDRFKIINDTLGHDLGDQLLRKVAERLTSCVRAEDTIARMGGDEFTLLLTSIDAKGSSVVAQKILTAISQPFNLEVYDLYITVSIGIAIYPNDGLKSETLLKNADVAMYHAKTAGKNRYEFYEPLMNDKALARMLRENSLRRALNEHELVLHYQPKVNVATKSIVGMEALVRWQHPELGLLYPDQFIPLAEYTGLIVPIGEWILRTACAQCKKWQDEGLTPLRVAVNLSYHQFQMQNLVECVSRVLRETGLEPRWLELEISEGLAMKNVEDVFSILMQLKEMGVTITTDDFGLYFSFAGLKYFPVHNLKINRSFVKDIGTNRNNEAIAATVLFLGESMDLGVIAEGVENQDQLDFLMQHNCSMMQGYIFGRPMEPEDFKKLLLGENKLSSVQEIN